jgi:hypothetical protein
MPELINTPVDGFVFVEKEQKTIVEENQSISSSINSKTSTTFEGISRDNTTQVILSFESHSQSICALNSISINRLLYNKYLLQQLHVNISLVDCVLVLEDSDKQLSTIIDTQKALSEYSTADNQPLHIRISILIEILKNDDQQQLKIPISNRNTTIEQILQLTNMPIEIYKYLASNLTKCIISNHEYISNLNETKFLLAKENETCLVSIKMSNELQLITIDDESDQIQRFLISATISNISKQNQIDTEQRFLLSADDFVPSLDTPLTSFLTTSPINFTVIEKNLPITITMINGEHSIKFHCSHSMKIKRLFLIACELFNIKINYYQLMHSDCEMDDDDATLDSLDSSMTVTEFKLVCKATLNASMKYLNQTFLFPCIDETELLDIVQETFIKLHIPQEEIDRYEIIALNEDKTQLELDTKMAEVLEFFSSNITTVPMELKKKEDET